MKRNSSRVGKVLKFLILAIFGFSIGAVCSLLFYEFVLTELNLSDSYQTLIFINVSVFLCVGFAFSEQIRCITCLSLPEFCGVSGKRFVQACVMILILSGPVENIGVNGEEVIRLVICFKDLTLNITLAGKDLLLAPIQHILYDIKNQEVNENSKYNFSELRAMMSPVIEEIEDQKEVDEIKTANDFMDLEMGHVKRSEQIEHENKATLGDTEGEKIQKTYTRKVTYRCEEIFSRGTQKCVDVFNRKYDDCSSAVTQYLAWALCWPMKITFICDILGMFAQDQICDLTGVIGDDFGSNYVAAKKGIGEFTQKFKIKIDYSGITNFVNADSIYLSEKEALESFQVSRAYIETYMDLVKRTLTLTFLFIILSALNYHGKYFERLSHDNCYLTKYFYRIDRRREFMGKSTLLPLKSFEQSQFTVVFRIGLYGDERRRFIIQVIMTLVQALVVGVLFIFDYFFTRLLQLVANHVDVTFRQKGSHTLKFEIEGNGFLAQLLRSIVSDINVQHNIDILHFTKPCLPNPRYLPKSYYKRTLCLFGVLFLMAYLEAVSIRLRHSIANFFYPARSKERILWLYNETRRRRVGKLIQLKEQVLENADEFRRRVDFNVLLGLSETFPRLCACLRICRSSQRKCVLCKLSGEAIRCPDCQFSYCEPCYEDVDRRCLYCIAARELHQEMYDDENILQMEELV